MAQYVSKMMANIKSRRRLGATKIEVTALGLGAAGLGSIRRPDITDETAAATVERAYHLGIRHVDTSPGYRLSQKRIGIALRRNDFSDLTISTKAGTHPERRGSYTREDIRWSVDNSRELLSRDCIDIVLIHDPPDMAPVLRAGDGFDALIELKEEGKIRHLGLGVFEHQFHYAALASEKVDVILTYGDYNLVRRTATPLIETARKAGVGVLLGSPLMHGFWPRVSQSKISGSDRSCAPGIPRKM